MKSKALWALAVLNVVLLGTLLFRGVRPNAAVAQVATGGNARPGDYIIIPVDFPGATVGTMVVLDNVSGQLSAIQTDEAKHSMFALPRINVADIFARENERGTPRPRR